MTIDEKGNKVVTSEIWDESGRQIETYPKNNSTADNLPSREKIKVCAASGAVRSRYLRCRVGVDEMIQDVDDDEACQLSRVESRRGL